MTPRYSVSRAGIGGRRRGEHPQKILPVQCTEEELEIMKRLSTRDRALAVLAVAKHVISLNNASAVIVDGDGATVI